MVWSGNSLTDALAYRPGTPGCECGCRSAPIWTRLSRREFERDAAQSGLAIESGHPNPDDYLVGPDYREVICRPAPEKSASDVAHLPGGNRAYVLSD
jgi:hypothetical protein